MLRLAMIVAADCMQPTDNFHVKLLKISRSPSYASANRMSFLVLGSKLGLLLRDVRTCSCLAHQTR